MLPCDIRLAQLICNNEQTQMQTAKEWQRLESILDSSLALRAFELCHNHSLRSIISRSDILCDFNQNFQCQLPTI